MVLWGQGPAYVPCFLKHYIEKWFVFLGCVGSMNHHFIITDILNVSHLNCLVQNYNAKISDFGLAKSGPAGEESHVTTRIMGTYGYAAPEYIATGTCAFYDI